MFLQKLQLWMSPRLLILFLTWTPVFIFKDHLLVNSTRKRDILWKLSLILTRLKINQMNNKLAKLSNRLLLIIRLKKKVLKKWNRLHYKRCKHKTGSHLTSTLNSKCWLIQTTNHKSREVCKTKVNLPLVKACHLTIWLRVLKVDLREFLKVLIKDLEVRVPTKTSNRMDSIHLI